MRVDSTFLAWLAGFVDGEGCIDIRCNANKRANASYSPVLSITNTVRAPLDEILECIGAGTIYTMRNRPGGRRDAYVYVVTSLAAQDVVRQIRPFLRIKGDQADVFLAFEAIDRKGATAGGLRTEQRADWLALRAPQRDLWFQMRALKNLGKPAPRPLRPERFARHPQPP